MAGLLYPHCCTATAVNIMLGVFHVLLPCLRQGGGQVIEPVPSMVELWQAEEGELMLPTQEETEHSTEEHSKEQNFVRPSGRALHLQPSVLDFGTQSLGLPKAQTFCAFNPSRDTDVEVNSVFTTSRHFHVSPIQSRVISARGKSFFTVVFLPDEEGSFESFLYVNTSSNGILSYQVFGLGAHNSGSENFKNSDVRFPHITNIHLSQPQGDAVNSSVWQVRLKCSISFRKEQQFTSCFLSKHSLLLQIYFAVRLDGSQHDLETLRKYILENIFMIFVTADQNGSLSDPFMSIYVLNSGNGLVHMQDIHHFLGDTLSVKFEPVMLLSSSINFTKAATIFLSATSHDAECSEDKKLNIPEAVSPPHLCVSDKVADGFIQFDTRKVSFYMQPLQDPIGLWSVWLENNLNVPIALNEVLVAHDAEGLFQILNFTHLLALLPGCWDVFTLKIQEKDMLLNFLTKISIITSFGAIFEIPLHFQPAIPQPANMQFKMTGECGMHPIIRSLDAEETLRWQQSLSLAASAWTIDYELGTVLYETYQQMQDGEACRIKSSECAKIAQEKRDAETSFTFLPQLIAKPGIVVNFTATALSNSSITYITLMNPSSFPVMVQLLPLSHYPNPQAALRLLSKWYGVSEQAIDLTTAEFTLQKQCNHGNHELENCSVEVLELQLLPWESQRVGVVFTPLDYRKVTSLIVIRNNLTVLDMISVEGVGAREMLRVGGRLPGIGGSLRFKVPESTLMDCRQQLKESKHILSITKIFKVENIGSLPITISSMKINGYKCQGFGFEVLDCNTFSLKQNSSRDIAIVFIPDFTSSWVIRELTLVSASNLEFRFTLNVTLPHHLLPLCADGVPGPSWEISFWKITVLFVSLSLLGVILIAVQQAQYILTESLKLRHRNSTSSVPQKVSSPVDTITSESYRSSCKTFTDPSNPPDKGKGKGFLSVAAPPNRSQNASKRGPATYSHSQKKHKCSVYYSIKQKPNSTNSPTVSCDTGQQQSSDTQPPTPTKDLNCNEELVTKWTDFKSADCTDTGNQKHLTNSDTVLSKVESALQNLLLPQRTANESTLKEEPLICMFPMETNPKTSEALSEPKQQDFCVLPVSSKVCENHLVRNVSPRQNESQAISRKMEDHEIQPSSSTCRENVGEIKKQSSRDIINDKIHCNAPREERASGKSEVSLAKPEEPYRKKGPNEKRDGVFPNLNWSKNRTSTRKNKKKNSVFPARSSEPQSDLKSKYQEVERTESRVQIRGKNWNPMINGDVYKGDQKAGRLHTGSETECYQGLRKKCVDKVSSDSSSDCSSSRGSVRASRGSWGSWSSTSSSDGDKKNIIPSRHFFPPRDNRSQNVFPADPPISLNLSHSICNTSSDINSITHYPEILSPSLTESEKNHGLFSQEDVWSTQPICMTNDLNYNAENTVACVMRNPPPVQNNFINWNSTCDSQFSGMYGPLELNNYNAYTEENMNYHNSFPCSDVQNPAFIDHQCHSTWNMSTSAPPPAPSPVPSAWEPASFVSTSPYLSSTRSLSPMSGLFGSIWAPQNDLYDGYCAVSSSPPHSDRIGNHSVLCKQEYSPRFNPFHAYMNLDISTTAANRNTNYPISRDSGYCGNM